MKLEFSRRVFEKCSNIKFHKIHPVGAELFHEDGRTDGRHGEANIRFPYFANAPKKCHNIVVLVAITLVVIISLN